MYVIILCQTALPQLLLRASKVSQTILIRSRLGDPAQKLRVAGTSQAKHLAGKQVHCQRLGEHYRSVCTKNLRLQIFDIARLKSQEFTLKERFSTGKSKLEIAIASDSPSHPAIAVLRCNASSPKSHDF